MHPDFEIYQATSGGAGDKIPGQHGSLALPSSAVASGGFTPQQIRTAYAIDQVEFGAAMGDGAGETIAIVDAYDDPALVDSTSANFKNSDLAQFDKLFGLPDPPSFKKLGQDGSTDLPGTDPSGEWEMEEALDVEWAHAIAPAASIVLIECDSAGLESLLNGGVITAASLPGVSVVSMCFGSSEFASEQSFDGDLTTPSGHQGVTFVASTGDSGSPGEYPACSPNVVAVGGTSLYVNGNNTYQSEVGWSCSGGGTSAYESEPTYQQGVQDTGKRTIPDVAFDADPNTGVQFYDSYDQANPCLRMGGTSLAAPCWAGLIAIADQGCVAAGGTTLDGPSQTLPALYSLPSGAFHDITSGCNGNQAAPGYDMVTGLGSPEANPLVYDLAPYPAPTQPAGSSDPTATQLGVSSQPPSSITAGNPFALTVDALDGSGVVDSSFNGPLSVVVEAGPQGGLLGGTLTVQAVHGVATFSNLTLDTAGSGYSLDVTGGGMTPATVTVASVAPAAAARLVVTSGPPPTVFSTGSFGFTVTVEDSYGNVATSFSGNIVVKLAGNHGKGRLRGSLIDPASSGVARFSSLTVGTVGKGYTLTVSGKGLIATTTPAFNVTLAPRNPLKTPSIHTLKARIAARTKPRA